MMFIGRTDMIGQTKRPRQSPGLHLTMPDQAEIAIPSCLKKRQDHDPDPTGQSEMQPRLPPASHVLKRKYH